jgi:phosphoribosylformylglycinamidine synthase PurS subunit
MGKYHALVEVQLRPGISDPQGATIERALPALGFSGVSGIRVGKAFRLHVEAADQNQARRLLEDLCGRLLANPVIEDATVSVVEAASVVEAVSAEQAAPAMEAPPV